MRRMLLFVVAVGLGLVVSAGPALASGQQLCIGGPGSPVNTPDAKGNCKKNETLTTLASESEVSSLQSQVSSLQSQVSTLQSDDSMLESAVSGLQTTLSKVNYDPTGLNGLPTLTISGANLQIVSGSGRTDGSVNGLGNLIIGYDENPGAQTGSHNLILGEHQDFESYGGLLAGDFNTLLAPFSAVLGFGNTASGPSSSVSGGEDNTASSLESSVSGGLNNRASGNASSVSGGLNNEASGDWSSILGGNGITVSDKFGTSP